MATFTETIVFEVVPCACGFAFGLPKHFVTSRRSDGKRFFCPACGTSLHWDKEDPSASDKKALAELKAELSRTAERERRARQDAEHFKASAASYQGQITKLKKRAANGVCPCCNRTFVNLHRHMQTKHPQFANDES